MTGLLASVDLLNGPTQAIYVNNRNAATVATINICNRNKQRSAKVRVAISTSQTPADTDWIEFDTEIGPGGVLERSGCWVDPLQFIVVRSNIANVSAVVWGATKGTVNTSAPGLTPVSVGTISWVTPAMSFTLTAHNRIRREFVANDSNGGTVFYSVVAGILPTGLGLTNDGVLEGRINNTGSFDFTIRASNGTNFSDRNFIGTITSGATSALDLLASGITTDGVYPINLPGVGVTNVFCLLNPIWNGGGWMMAMKANSTGTTFQYSSNLWTTDNVLNPASVDQTAADAKFEVMNKYPARDIMARWPDIGVSGGSIPGTGTWTWMENDFNNGARQTLISFFNTPSNRTFQQGFAGEGYFIRDAKTFSGWQAGVFSSQVDIRFYGFNYSGPGFNTAVRVRWGFGWNENGEGLFPGATSLFAGTNDVFGGIGLDANGNFWSAGDRIACCQDTTGINRQARVEIYVR